MYTCTTLVGRASILNDVLHDDFVVVVVESDFHDGVQSQKIVFFRYPPANTTGISIPFSMYRNSQFEAEIVEKREEGKARRGLKSER